MSDNKQRLMEELHRRLDQLDCLARATKDLIVAAANRASVRGLHDYLDRVLLFVEREIGSVDHRQQRRDFRPHAGRRIGLRGPSA